MRLCAAFAVSLLVASPAYARGGHGGGTGCGAVDAAGLPTGSQVIDSANSPSGSIKNGFGTWTFGPIITPSSAAGLPIPSSSAPYRFVALNGKVINNISSAVTILLDCSGNVFFLTTQNDRWWFEFVGYSFGAFVGGNTTPPYFDLSSVQYAPGPPVLIPPYPPSSPDGTTFSGSGTLNTADGTWALSGGALTLNGRAMASPPPGGSVTDIEVASNGQFYAKAGGTWQVWLDWIWYAAGSSVPAGPIPIRVTVVVASPFFPTYGGIPAQNLATGVTTSTAIGTGTTVANIAVTMSDGSPFSGTLGVSTTGSLGANVLAIYLSTLYLNAHPTTTGYDFFTVTATQNGVTTDAGPSIIEVNVSS